MGEPGTDARWFRVAFGRPRIRSGIVWLVIAVCWLVVTVAEGTNPWGYLIAAIWAITGSVMLTIAVRDQRHGRGAYAPPAGGPED